jgi:hypothetical protein
LLKKVCPHVVADILTVLFKTPNCTHIVCVVLVVVVLIAIVEVLIPGVVVIVLTRTPIVGSGKTPHEK